MTAHMPGYAVYMQEFHANQAMFAELAQDHSAALDNLANATQFDRMALIMLTATNATLTQQLIEANLKLPKALAETAWLKSASPAQAQTIVTAEFDPTGYCWSHN